MWLCIFPKVRSQSIRLLEKTCGTLALQILNLFQEHQNIQRKTREDVLLFLGSFRKAEAVDPLYKWIGTYDIYRIHLLRSFKWLYSLGVEQDKGPSRRLSRIYLNSSGKRSQSTSLSTFGLRKTIPYFWNIALILEIDVTMQCLEIQQEELMNFWNWG
jgi:hypothetical protein